MHQVASRHYSVRHCFQSTYFMLMLNSHSSGSRSRKFDVWKSVKQGCVPVPSLFEHILFSTTTLCLSWQFWHLVAFALSRKLFNHNHVRAKTKVCRAFVSEHPQADDTVWSFSLLKRCRTSVTYLQLLVSRSACKSARERYVARSECFCNTISGVPRAPVIQGSAGWFQIQLWIRKIKFY